MLKNTSPCGVWCLCLHVCMCDCFSMMLRPCRKYTAYQKKIWQKQHIWVPALERQWRFLFRVSADFLKDKFSGRFCRGFFLSFCYVCVYCVFLVRSFVKTCANCGVFVVFSYRVSLRPTFLPVCVCDRVYCIFSSLPSVFIFSTFPSTLLLSL